jgi:hypothetical protein
LNSTKIHNTVGGADREAVPLRPPVTQGMAHIFVERVLKQEMDMVDTGSSGSKTVGVGGSQCEINLHKVPARASSAGREVRDKE